MGRRKQNQAARRGIREHLYRRLWGKKKLQKERPCAKQPPSLPSPPSTSPAPLILPVPPPLSGRPSPLTRPPFLGQAAGPLGEERGKRLKPKGGRTDTAPGEAPVGEETEWCEEPGTAAGGEPWMVTSSEGRRTECWWW